MLYMETPDDVLKNYTKERCEEVVKMYDDLKICIMQLVNETDEKVKFDLLSKIANHMKDMQYEQVDTLDRYLYSYELNKRLENKITKLENPEFYEEES